MSARELTEGKPRRGRPSRSQAQEIDRAVLDAARDCFIARGFDAATMDEIAELAGVSKATLYVRHESKIELLNAVIDDRIAVWGRQSSRHSWMKGSTLAERLTHYGRSMLVWTRNDELASLSRLLRSEDAGSGVMGQSLHNRLRAPMIELLAREFGSFAEIDSIPIRDPRRVAILFLGMLLGYPMMGVTGDGGEREEADYVESVVAVLMRGREAW